MPDIISNDLSYSNVSTHSGFYKYQPVFPEQAQPTLSATSSVDSPDFVIPANVVFNLAKSHIEFSLVSTPSLTPSTYYSQKFNIGTPAFPFEWIRLSTNSGRVLCEINDVGKVMKPLVRALPLNKTSLYARPVGSMKATLALANSSTDYRPCNPLCLGNTNTTTVAGPVSLPVKPADGLYENQAITGVYNDKISDFVQYTITNTDLLGTVILRVQIPLESFIGTVFTMDKNLYFNEPLRLKVRFLKTDSFAYGGTATATMAGQVNIATGASLVSSTLKLILARQADPEIEMAVKQKFMSGIVLNMPWIERDKITVSASSANSYQRQINRSQGLNLKRIVVAPFSTTDTFARFYCNNNTLQDLYTYVRTYLDGNPLSDDKLSVMNGEVYGQMSKIYEGSSLGGVEGHAWCDHYVNDFTGFPAKDWIQTDLSDGGISLDKPRDIRVELTTGAQCTTFYLIMMCSKQLKISSQGVEVY